MAPRTSQNEVAALYGRIAGREPRVRHMPYELVRVLATVLGAFHPGIARIMRASLAARATDQTFDPSALLSAHPMVLTRLEDVARELAAGTSAAARGRGASVASSSQ